MLLNKTTNLSHETMNAITPREITITASTLLLMSVSRHCPEGVTHDVYVCDVAGLEGK